MKTGKLSQSTKRRIDNRSAVAAEANGRLNKYKWINADTKKKTKGIQIKPLPIEDNTKLTKDGVNEVSGLDPLHAPPDAPGRADFEHKFNSDSNEAMIWRSFAVASIIDKRYKATIASMADQSKAMIAYGKEWTFEEMNSYLIKPQAYVKGTKMAFAGLRKEKDRASVILFMNSKSSNPKPLP